MPAADVRGAQMPAVTRGPALICTCDVCGKAAHLGYGRMWACFEHAAEVERRWVAMGSPVK